MVGRKCSFLVALGAVALCLLAPGRSSAQAGPFGPASLWIDDGSTSEVINIIGNAANSYGFDPTSFNLDVVQEGIGQLGVADFHGEWFDSNALPPGQDVTLNYALIYPPYETDPRFPSDTISISLHGHSPNGRLNNMSVDVHFRSDSLDELAPPPLANQIVMNETADFINFTPLMQAATAPFTPLPGGIQDFDFRARSDVPEPGSMAMLCGMVATGGLAIWRRRRRA